MPSRVCQSELGESRIELDNIGQIALKSLKLRDLTPESIS